LTVTNGGEVETRGGPRGETSQLARTRFEATVPLDGVAHLSHGMTARARVTAPPRSLLQQTLTHLAKHFRFLR
jgi:hypothetical protein